MTPYELSICLHYYCRAEDWPLDAEIAEPTLESFVNLGLLTKPGTFNGTKYGKTAMLDAFVERLQSLPLPVQKWVMLE